ncbi:GGDEF domain-containing protein [Aestuariirhabdus sp. Z084]|uniref:GGDEF domain-containing protein n=1 Tax=Aestuariirhabdus haliotis TaxID=2918751 RepID=UPI00201B3DDF|nr:GGDEF domain-containing protein [Aestuariirhabdus haliotis]MCL6415748.1 GGDEF domain-containing protein [Aestuariirhabdus haliotis]MCL6419665.1 GGDEF domain-containing protein [Aestuariirhabdus haliotis]
MIKELDIILQNRLLTPFFMPIINSQRRCIIGYEALIRAPDSSPLHSPLTLFNTAQRCERLLELELLCRERSIRRFKQLNLQGKLFLNVTPETLIEEDFRSGLTLELLHQVGLDSRDIVIEITEQLPIENYALMKEATRHYRELGFEVALDDLGAGYSGLKSWSELQPQFVKIDRHFIEQIDSNNVKREFVRSILEVSRSIDCCVIAEGIERVEEHLVLNELGLEFQQGYYFGRPSPKPARYINKACFQSEFSSILDTQHHQDLGSITHIRPAVTTDTLLGEVADIFRQNEDLHSIAIVDQDRPVGLFNHERFLSLYLNPFGKEVYDKKEVAQFMDPAPLVLEEHTALEEVSKRIAESDRSSVRSDFIVTRQGRYLGTGSIMDLLKQVTDLQLRHARYANPLTLLPGSTIANEAISLHLREHTPFYVAYVDIDHFKAFNDSYGYERGDRMICLLADVLAELCDSDKDQVFHIGGDDFLLLMTVSEWRVLCDQVLTRFRHRSRSLYDAPALEEGGITGQDRAGKQTFFPLVSLSIGVAQPDSQHCNSHHEVACLANDAKKIAKQRAGDSLFFNQRRTTQSRTSTASQQ